jgi:hypothetical protein
VIQRAIAAAAPPKSLCFSRVETRLLPGLFFQTQRGPLELSKSDTQYGALSKAGSEAMTWRASGPSAPLNAI